MGYRLSYRRSTGATVIIAVLLFCTMAGCTAGEKSTDATKELNPDQNKGQITLVSEKPGLNDAFIEYRNIGAEIRSGSTTSPLYLHEGPCELNYTLILKWPTPISTVQVDSYRLYLKSEKSPGQDVGIVAVARGTSPVEYGSYSSKFEDANIVRRNVLMDVNISESGNYTLTETYPSMWSDTRATQWVVTEVYLVGEKSADHHYYDVEWAINRSEIPAYEAAGYRIGPYAALILGRQGPVPGAATPAPAVTAPPLPAAPT